MLDGVSPEIICLRSQPSRTITLGREGILVLGLLLETALIVALSLATGLAYHIGFYAELGQVGYFVGIGLLVAILYEMPLIISSHYGKACERVGERGLVRLVNAWTYAFLCIAVIGFLTKTSDLLSRGWLVLFYATGTIGVLGFEIAVRNALAAAAAAGFVVARRLVVVGKRSDVERFEREHVASHSDIQIVATAFLPEDRKSGEAGPVDIVAHLRPIVEAARLQGVSDVVVLSDFVEWSRGDEATLIADLFLDLPVAVHLGQIGAVEQYPNLRAAKIGTARTLVLRCEPLSMTQVLAKRAFDIVSSAVALVMLAPVFAVVALLIKCDSAGPVFFRQQRRGFNHKVFAIWKFRTMTSMDDGDTIVQARHGDARVTRIGRYLRKYNIDELPQLINVLTGDMSLVGPRPHAVAHDRQYERTVERYARRLNVKPGITGWAQIHGLRGVTETDAAMQARVAHDLHYIESWSIALDVYILVMTVFSSKAYRNAY